MLRCRCCKYNSIGLSKLRFYATTVRFTKSHEWLRYDDANVQGAVSVVMGITDHAQGELGDVSFVDLPEVGTEFSENDLLLEIESIKATSEVRSPVSGGITAVNANLEDDPSLLNRSANQDGWLVKFETSDIASLGDLMDEDEYHKISSNKD